MLLKPVLAVVVGVVAFVAGSLVLGHSNYASGAKTDQSHIAPVALHQVAAPTSPAGLLAMVETNLHLDMSHAQDIGQFGAGAATAHLQMAPRTTGGNCLLIDSDIGAASTCLTGTDLFRDHKVVYLVQSDGGPALSGLKYLRVSGVAAPGVDAVKVISTSGSTTTVHLNASRGFVYNAPLASVHSGDAPATLEAFSGGQSVGLYPLNQ